MVKQQAAIVSVMEGKNELSLAVAFSAGKKLCKRGGHKRAEQGQEEKICPNCGNYEWVPAVE